MLPFNSKFHGTFPLFQIDGNECEAHEMISFNITLAYSWKGQHISKGISSKFKSRFISRELTLAPWSPQWHDWAKIHCLADVKHLGCYTSLKRINTGMVGWTLEALYIGLSHSKQPRWDSTLHNISYQPHGATMGQMSRVWQIYQTIWSWECATLSLVKFANKVQLYPIHWWSWYCGYSS